MLALLRWSGKSWRRQRCAASHSSAVSCFGIMGCVRCWRGDRCSLRDHGRITTLTFATCIFRIPQRVRPFVRHPLDFRRIAEKDATRVHLVVVGFGQMGKSLALHAARVGHYANAVKIRITVVDRAAGNSVDAFRKQYPMIDHVCELDAYDASPTESGFLEALAKQSRDSKDGKDLVTYAVCFETEETAHDRETLRIGIEISRAAAERPVQTLIYQGTRCGFGAIFAAASAELRAKPRLHAFGMLEDIFTWDTLLHESEDQVAEALHSDYAVKHPRKDGTVERWEDLTENLKESNRQAADHIPTKLRALGYLDGPVQRDQAPIEGFTPEEVLLLSKMEHRRWCAERWLDGWEYGPVTIREKKLNCCLIEWDQLPAEERQKDPEQIKAIPQVLRTVRRAIYRANGGHSTPISAKRKSPSISYQTRRN